MPWIYLLILLISCQSTQVTTDNSPGLPAYWYEGKAEVSVFDLNQNRYDALHPGEAVLIQVTEDFNTAKQVKSERGPNASSTSVLKTNLIERFTTGIYDYSVMTSTFTSVSSANTLKVNASSQDWCGQGFLQFNQKDEGYRWQQRSYFESEADDEGKIEDALMEDEIYNLIRIYGPEISTGPFQIIPSSRYLQHKHLPIKPVPASIKVVPSQDGMNKLIIDFPSLDREKIIHFDPSPPYYIQGWEDTYPSAFDGVKRTTTAMLKTRELTPYWQKNGIEDQKLRNKLGLRTYD